ncbi:hypothetical protein BX070DRAFT_141060 [Coemansia spiralis]|nr:hypothetical protein BX070DRAFT_141060 [Coemansia spiralis]
MRMDRARIYVFYSLFVHVEKAGRRWGLLLAFVHGHVYDGNLLSSRCFSQASSLPPSPFA